MIGLFKTCAILLLGVDVALGRARTFEGVIHMRAIWILFLVSAFAPAVAFAEPQYEDLVPKVEKKAVKILRKDPILKPLGITENDVEVSDHNATLPHDTYFEDIVSPDGTYVEGFRVSEEADAHGRIGFVIKKGGYTI